MNSTYYTSRAQAAYAAAEAADDPHDKCAFRAAARTWEQLAKPATQPTYSMEPHRLQLAALKRDVAEAIEAPAPAPAVAVSSGEKRRVELQGKIVVIAKPAVAIEF
jgi:hypothetical protein